MGFSDEQRRRIVDAIYERIPEGPICPLCGKKDWALQEEFAFQALHDDPHSIHATGGGLPLVVLTCQHCGNTHNLNIFTLGLHDALDFKKKDGD